MNNQSKKIECPDDIFKELKKVVDTYANLSDSAMSFAYEALGEGLEFPGPLGIITPEWDDEILKDWSKLKQWIDRVYPVTDSYSFPEEFADEEFDTPFDYFKYKDAIYEKIKTFIPEENTVLGSVEITNNGESLFLIYTDFDAWTLGHADNVLVVGNLDDLVAKHGFLEP